jgi:hypothetical protein
MHRHGFVFIFFAVAATVFAAGGSPVFAQLAANTWVSGVGDDTNPCTYADPCATFAQAISETAPGGEVDVLDPGDFGPIEIL